MVHKLCCLKVCHTQERRDREGESASKMQEESVKERSLLSERMQGEKGGLVREREGRGRRE